MRNRSSQLPKLLFSKTCGSVHAIPTKVSRASPQLVEDLSSTTARAAHIYMRPGHVLSGASVLLSVSSCLQLSPHKICFPFLFMYMLSNLLCRAQSRGITMLHQIRPSQPGHL